MIAFLDVDYRAAAAVAAAVLATDWADPTPAVELVARIPEVAEYVPGEFYRRELPCLLAVLDQCSQRPDVIVVDGYVWLGPDRPGLGARLFDALGQTIPVIGVGKTCFRSAVDVATPVYRAGSRQALWVTSAGIDQAVAAMAVQAMHGPHRLPTLIKRVDHLCRNS
jgi:deoxyribonuclease V